MLNDKRTHLIFLTDIQLLWFSENDSISGSAFDYFDFIRYLQWCDPTVIHTHTQHRTWFLNARWRPPSHHCIFTFWHPRQAFFIRMPISSDRKWFWWQDDHPILMNFPFSKILNDNRTHLIFWHTLSFFDFPRMISAFDYFDFIRYLQWCNPTR